MINHYRSKPIHVEAIRMTANNVAEVMVFDERIVGSFPGLGYFFAGRCYHAGSWAVRYHCGHLDIMPNNEFERTFEPVPGEKAEGGE